MPASQSIPDDASKSLGDLERLLEVTEPSSSGSTKRGTTYKLHSGSHLPVAVAGPPGDFLSILILILTHDFKDLSLHGFK